METNIGNDDGITISWVNLWAMMMPTIVIEFHNKIQESHWYLVTDAGDFTPL